jgi:hypothetical protein
MDWNELQITREAKPALLYISRLDKYCTESPWLSRTYPGPSPDLSLLVKSGENMGS